MRRPCGWIEYITLPMQEIDPIKYKEREKGNEWGKVEGVKKGDFRISKGRRACNIAVNAQCFSELLGNLDEVKPHSITINDSKCSISCVYCEKGVYSTFRS